MYALNIARATKKMLVNEIRGFIFGNYYKRIGFSRESGYYSLKHLKQRFIVACEQINRKKYLIFPMLKNTINHLYEKKQNQ